MLLFSFVVILSLSPFLKCPVLRLLCNTAQMYRSQWSSICLILSHFLPDLRLTLCQLIPPACWGLLHPISVEHQCAILNRNPESVAHRSPTQRLMINGWIHIQLMTMERFPFTSMTIESRLKLGREVIINQLQEPTVISACALSSD